LGKLVNEYEQAKAQAASHRREAKRLESEIADRRGNLAVTALSAEQVEWLDNEDQMRLTRIRELADLENQPIGAAVGPPVPGEEDMELVKGFLTNRADVASHQRSSAPQAGADPRILKGRTGSQSEKSPVYTRRQRTCTA
jgi:hypothetical protein